MSAEKMFYAVVIVCVTIRCNPRSEVSTTRTEQQNVAEKGVKVLPFGEMPDGQKVSLYTLTNKNGLRMSVMNYGGIITALEVPDRNGVNTDIVLGYDSLSGYLKSNPYFGALIGRYGNRIARGKFTLDGKEYTLATNNGANHLHGGIKGFDKVFWNIEELKSDNGVALRLSYKSRDMEEGYPGNLDAEVTYLLSDSNQLQISYRATTDKKTIVNLTQHTYFNLTGADTSILSHELRLYADKFLPVDATLIPTGEFRNVDGTPFDFMEPKAIGSRIDQQEEQLKIGNGYDHCWALTSQNNNEGLRKAAELYEPRTGRLIIVTTTEPGIQFYSGNFLDGSLTGKRANKYDFRDGLCLETQHFPDSPNRKDFPSVALSPGEVYTSKTIYTFTVR